MNEIRNRSRLGNADRIIYLVLIAVILTFSVAVGIFAGRYSRELAFRDPAVLAAAPTGIAAFIPFIPFFEGMLFGAVLLVCWISRQPLTGLGMQPRPEYPLLRRGKTKSRDVRFVRRLLICLAAVFVVSAGVSCLAPNSMNRLYDDGSLTRTGLTGKIENEYASVDFGKVSFGTFQDVEGDTKNATLRLELAWKEHEYAFELHEFRGENTAARLAAMAAVRALHPAADTKNMITEEEYLEIVEYTPEEAQLVQEILTEHPHEWEEHDSAHGDDHDHH